MKESPRRERPIRLGLWVAASALLVWCIGTRRAAAQAGYEFAGAALLLVDAPTGARVQIDGAPAPQPRSDGSIDARPGAHDVEILVDGEPPIRLEVFLDAGRTTRVRVPPVAVEPAQRVAAASAQRVAAASDQRVAVTSARPVAPRTPPAVVTPARHDPVSTPTPQRRAARGLPFSLNGLFWFGAGLTIPAIAAVVALAEVGGALSLDYARRCHPGPIPAIECPAVYVAARNALDQILTAVHVSTATIVVGGSAMVLGVGWSILTSVFGSPRPSAARASHAWSASGVSFSVTF